MTIHIKKIATIILLFSLTSVSAQGIVNKWVLGYTGGGGQIQIQFNSDSIVSIDTMQLKMNFLDLNTSISDSHGNLLFYTNGGWVANSTHDTMMNGNDLAPGTYATQWKYDGFRIVQGALVIPFPSDSSKFYLFHETAYLNGIGDVVSCKNLFYSTIDINLDSGLGGIVLKNQVALNDSIVYGELTACKHANGRDWWVFTHQVNTDLFFKFLVTPTGINSPYLQSIGSVQTQNLPGQTCFSPDGKKFARYTASDDLDIYDFDRCSGLLSNPIHIPISDSAECSGLAFSGNSKYLYASSQYYVYQFDVDATNIALTKDTIAVFDGFAEPNTILYTYFYLAQLGPDGRIYISVPTSSKYFHVINSPDSAGSACNISQHGVYIKAFNGFSIPNHPNYFLGADSGSVCDTLMLSIHQPVFEKENFTAMIFPNPAQNYFFINSELQINETEQFILYNSLGKEMLRKKLLGTSKTFLINIFELQNGVYFFKLKNQSGKLVIIK